MTSIRPALQRSLARGVHHGGGPKPAGVENRPERGGEEVAWPGRVISSSSIRREWAGRPGRGRSSRCSKGILGSSTGSGGTLDEVARAMVVFFAALFFAAAVGIGFPFFVLVAVAVAIVAFVAGSLGHIGFSKRSATYRGPVVIWIIGFVALLVAAATQHLSLTAFLLGLLGENHPEPMCHASGGTKHHRSAPGRNRTSDTRFRKRLPRWQVRSPTLPPGVRHRPLRRRDPSGARSRNDLECGSQGCPGVRRTTT